MIIKSAKFIKSAANPSQYPPADLPEIAFAGRSNVGKSSLINTLVNRKHLVKTSSTPGRTQLINFFVINDAFLFVDLPGFGYARVPKSVKRKWGPMVETYFSTRETLRGVVLIVDIRRIPDQKELYFIDWFDYYNVSGILIMTKADKISKTKQINQRRSIAKALDIDEKELILFSAKSRQGKDAVWKAVEKML